MKIHTGIYPNCSEWDEEVGSDSYEEDDSIYEELLKNLKREVKEENWDK